MPKKKPLLYPVDARMLEQILATLGENSKSDPAFEAQELIYEAFECNSKNKRVSLAKKALEIYPHCADAYTLLAQETAKSTEEEIALLRVGVAAGEKALGKKTFKEEVGYFWGLLETRPYMRARKELATALWQQGDKQEAVQHLQEMMVLNPNDNQGVRYILLSYLIDLRDFEAIEKLRKPYKDECMAEWLYNMAILSLIKHGDSKKSRDALAKAQQSNRHVYDALASGLKAPKKLPPYYTMGSAEEAGYYCDLYSHLWKECPGAIAWLKNQPKLPAKKKVAAKKKAS